MLDIEAHRQPIGEICRSLGIERLDVFGSSLTGDFGPESDVDVLVRFDRRRGDLFNRFFELKELLEKLFSRPVDVVMEKNLKNPFLRQTIEENRRNVFVA